MFAMCASECFCVFLSQASRLAEQLAAHLAPTSCSQLKNVEVGSSSVSRRWLVPPPSRNPRIQGLPRAWPTEPTDSWLTMLDVEGRDVHDWREAIWAEDAHSMIAVP